jgi:hypothetical protein
MALKAELPKNYHLDEIDPGVLVLLRDSCTFVAAFLTRGATKEGILQAAREAAWNDQAALVEESA